MTAKRTYYYALVFYYESGGPFAARADERPPPFSRWRRVSRAEYLDLRGKYRVRTNRDRGRRVTKAQGRAG